MQQHSVGAMAVFMGLLVSLRGGKELLPGLLDATKALARYKSHQSSSHHKRQELERLRKMG
jgi:hypothetical protein